MDFWIPTLTYLERKLSCGMDLLSFFDQEILNTQNKGDAKAKNQEKRMKGFGLRS
jgi:hypothetical protein